MLRNNTRERHETTEYYAESTRTVVRINRACKSIEFAVFVYNNIDCCTCCLLFTVMIFARYLRICLNRMLQLRSAFNDNRRDEKTKITERPDVFVLVRFVRKKLYNGENGTIFVGKPRRTYACHVGTLLQRHVVSQRIKMRKIRKKKKKKKSDPSKRPYR